MIVRHSGSLRISANWAGGGVGPRLGTWAGMRQRRASPPAKTGGSLRMSTLASTPVLLRTDRSQAARDRENAHRSASLSRRLAVLSRIRRRYQTAEQELRI